MSKTNFVTGALTATPPASTLNAAIVDYLTQTKAQSQNVAKLLDQACATGIARLLKGVVPDFRAKGDVQILAQAVSAYC